MGELKSIGRYQIDETIASGGMATVYLARIAESSGFEKRVALKVLHEHLGQHQDFVKMFIDEARLSATLVHGNIVPVFDFGEEGGRYFLAMEYFAGTSLSRFLKARSKRRRGILPLRHAVYILSEILSGLDYAHNKMGKDGEPLRIVHRDISPQNILLTTYGEVRIADFGIAHARERLTLSEVGVVKGKQQYMAPEQAAGKAVSQRADLYSVGAIALELLTGQESPKAMSQVSTDAKPMDLGQIRQEHLSQLDEPWRTVLSRALQPSPAKRFSTASAFRKALLDVAGDVKLDANLLAADVVKLQVRRKEKPVEPRKHETRQPEASQLHTALRDARIVLLVLAAMFVCAFVASLVLAPAPEVMGVAEATSTKSSSAVEHASLEVTSGTPAVLYINQMNVGVTPRTLQLPPGTYKLRLVPTAKGVRPVTLTRRLKSGSFERIYIPLAKKNKRRTKRRHVAR